MHSATEDHCNLQAISLVWKEVESNVSLLLTLRQRRDPLRLQHSETRFSIRRGDVLRWIYLGRLTLISGILVAALLVWRRAEPTQTFIVTVAFLASLGLTSLSFWHTELRGREPGDGFVYLQVIFDALLVTAIVHVTGGADSNFPFLYILVISFGALLLPLPGGVLVLSLIHI